MLFKDLKQGSPVYILYRDSLAVKKGVVTSVSLPHLNTTPLNTNPNGTTPNMGMVIDLGVSVDNQNGVYTINDSSEICHTDSLVLTPNIDNLLNEIKGIKQQSESALQMVDTYKSNIEKCNNLLKEYDPIFKERALVDDRLSSMEKLISQVSEDHKLFMDWIKSHETK